MNEQDANAERQAATLRAEKIRRQGLAQRSQAINDLASSGVDISSISATKIDETIAARVNEDAVQEVLYGSNRGRRLDQQAQLNRQAGLNYERGGYLSAAGSLLSTGAKAGRGWPRSVQQVNEMAPGQYSTVNRQYG